MKIITKNNKPKELDTLKEQFYNEFLARLSEQISDDALQSVSKVLSIVLDKYEVTKKSYDIS